MTVHIDARFLIAAWPMDLYKLTPAERMEQLHDLQVLEDAALKASKGAPRGSHSLKRHLALRRIEKLRGELRQAQLRAFARSLGLDTLPVMRAPSRLQHAIYKGRCSWPWDIFDHMRSLRLPGGRAPAGFTFEPYAKPEHVPGRLTTAQAWLEQADPGRWRAISPPEWTSMSCYLHPGDTVLCAVIPDRNSALQQEVQPDDVRARHRASGADGRWTDRR